MLPLWYNNYKYISMITSIAKRLVFGAVALFSVATLAIAQAPQLPPLPIDSAVKVGKLDNGLTYFIRKNKHPEGRAHFYISQKVGSMQEEESQRGLAHFLEHIAFNGTKNFPGKSMIEWLQTIGVKFGANLNAYTSFDETVYQIMDAPTARQSTVDSCLLILHDWSSSISLLDKEIDDERGVIREEWRQRDGGNFRVMAKMIEDAFPGNKYGQRMPIGLMSVVNNFKYEELRNYYKKWYRPDLQGLIIVGDIDPEKVEATIKRQFADVPKPVNPAPRVYEPVADFKGVRTSVATDKEAVGTRLSVYFITDAAPAEVRASQVGPVQDYLKSIIAMVMNERFSDIVKMPNAPFMQAGAGIDNFIVAQTKDAFTFTAVAADGKYQPALKRLVNEIERLGQFGINKSEYERAKKDFMISMKKSYDEREKRKNGAYAEEYSNYFTRGGYIPGIEMEYTLMQTLSEQIPVEVVNQMLKQSLGVKDNIFVSLTGPAKEGISYPTTDALVAEFNAMRAEKVEPLKETVSDTKLIDKAPKAGKVVKVDKNGKFGSTVWTLSNGVKVIIKPTTFKEDEIRFTASRPGGLSAFDKKDELSVRAINQVINLGGLGKFDDSALGKALSGRIASASPSFGNLTDNIFGSSTKADLETMMQLIYLNFTAKRSDKEAYTAFIEKSLNMLKMREANPMASVGDSIAAALYPGDARQRSLNEAEFKALNYERMMQMYKERFANANGFQFIFVGNIDEAKLRPLVETYLASLPATKAVVKADRSKLPVVRKGTYTNHYRKKQETPMGFVFNFYSAKIPVSQKSRLTAYIMSDILDQVYVETIREREGGTYGASASASINYDPKDDAYVQVVYQTDPAKAAKLNAIVNEELQRMAKEGADKAKFDKVIANYEKEYSENQKENGYWISELSNFYNNGRDSHSDYLTTLRSITPEGVGQLLKQILDQKNTIEVMLLPEETKK